jgi:predicted restriction endonuclease
MPTPDVLADVERIRKTVKNKTTKKRLIDARLGQGRFRASVENRWNGRCAVTGCAIPALMRASHIKPWSESTNRERLNPANGVFLAAHIDALFDRGLISFANNGSMLLSSEIDMGELRRLRLPRSLRRKPDAEERKFFQYHRRRYRFLDGK